MRMVVLNTTSLGCVIVSSHVMTHDPSNDVIKLVFTVNDRRFAKLLI